MQDELYSSDRLSEATGRPFIDLQAPPFTRLQGNTDFEDATVELFLASGELAAGKLLAFDMHGDVVTLRSASGEPAHHNISDIRYLKVLTPYRLAATEPGKRQALQNLDPAQHLRHFVMEFSDHSVLEGRTLGSRVSHNGIHLYQVDESVDAQHAEECFHLFVSKSALANYSVGEKLGHILVEEQQISEATLNAALDEQQRRIKKIGEFLVAQKIVDAEALEEAIERQKHIPNLKLGEILVSEGLITESQLAYALKEQKRKNNIPLGQILIEQGFLQKDQLQRYLARKLGIPFVNLREFIIEPDILQLLPANLAFRFGALPLMMYEGHLVVAVENPLDWETLNILRFTTGLNIDPAMATDEEISWAVQFYYSTDDVDISFSELDTDEADDENTILAREGFTMAETSEIQENVVVKIINKMIKDAYYRKVSDIHIEPGMGEQKVVVRFRKDGTLSVYYRFPAKYRAVFVARLKVMAHLDVSLRFMPQDGKIDFRKHGEVDLELRVATLPTAGGVEDVVIRLLSGGKVLPVRGIGLSTPDLENLLDLVARPHGLFLVCGPTGSGKTTTLHSVLAHLNTSERKIWTAEDPVEITQPGLRQVQINNKTGLTYEKVMRAFLRADPDVIMIGEMRDPEAASIAIEASLTGHLVLSTLHTNGAAETVARLLEMGMDEFNFSDSLLGVLSQRLVKTLCVSCKTAYLPDNQEVELLAAEYLRECTEPQADNAPPALVAVWRERYFSGKDVILFRAGGCKECAETGYRGRIGVYELLRATAQIKELILQKASAAQLETVALAEGMVSRKQDGIVKVVKGLTDFSQVRTL